jgi:hypothetical protein
MLCCEVKREYYIEVGRGYKRLAFWVQRSFRPSFALTRGIGYRGGEEDDEEEQEGDRESNEML